MHLDAHSYAALIRGTLSPGEARSLREHIDGDCGQCERFLAAQTEVDAFDGETDALVSVALPPAAGAGNDLEFARILREVGARSPVSRPRRLSLALAAASILVIGVTALVARELPGRNEPAPSWDGVKGRKAQAIPVRLRFLVREESGAMQKGISGDRVPSASSLVFEVETGRAAQLALVRVSPGGGSEILWRSGVGAGRTQVTVSGRPAAYPLATLTGSQRFVLIASDAALDDARAMSAGAALAPPAGVAGDAAALDGLSLDVVDVSVQ